MGEGDIFVESLHETEHFYTCVEVQKKVWGMDDILVVPVHLLITAQKNGGLVLGAFTEEGQMVGYLFGFLGTREPASHDQSAAERLKHCSHMMGVLPEYQTKGIGYLLKLRQREHVLSQELDLATWTYDPLESVNANLNVCKLGVVCDTYLRDIWTNDRRAECRRAFRPLASRMVGSQRTGGETNREGRREAEPG